MSLLFLNKGLLTTVQDLGRFGFQNLGINPNGAMDKRAARLINVLLENDENEGVLEMHFPAPKILFETDALIALGGADFGAKINEREVENWRVLAIEKGSVLRFERKISGERLYLAAKGGFELEKWLESFSTNLKAKAGGFEGRALQKGDRIGLRAKVKSQKAKFAYRISSSLIPDYSNTPKIRVIEGAEWADLTELSVERFLSQAFTIRPESDRMGFRLSGAMINLKNKSELLSSAVNFGTIQLPPDGQPIILMADHQTTGGYPRIAHVASCDLPVLAQFSACDSIRFELISLAEAENCLLKFENRINWLKIGCRLKQC